MRILYYTGLVLILLFVSSCSFLDYPEENIKEEKISIEEKDANNYVKCPSYYIPSSERFLKNKKNEKLLSLYSVKLNCKLEKNNSDNKVIITQTIYYQILKRKLKINSSQAKVFIALVDEGKNKIKFKVLSKIRITPTVKAKNKLFFKNSNSFKINLDKTSERLVFYYGFQS